MSTLLTHKTILCHNYLSKHSQIKYIKKYVKRVLFVYLSQRIDILMYPYFADQQCSIDHVYITGLFYYSIEVVFYFYQTPYVESLILNDTYTLNFIVPKLAHTT